MLWFYILISVVAVAILAIQLYWIWMVRKAQHVYLKEVQSHAPTMFDVREVLLQGDKDLAVKLYCEIFNLDDVDRARKEVEDLERSLKD